MSDRVLPYLPDDISNKQIPILVVDDLRDNLDLMEALLVSEGFEVVHLIPSGQEALEFLEAHRDIGVILMDMMMPGIDGHEMCRRITTHESTRHIPVIIVTGGALRHNEAVQKSFAAGAVDFVTKPINEVELFMRIHSALALYRERVIRHHKTRELRESEEKFRVTFDQAPVGIAHVNADGRLLLINRRLCEMLGFQERELIESSFPDLCVPENRDVHDRELKKSVEQGLEYHGFEIPLVHKDGRIIWTKLTLSPMKDAAGVPKYFIHIVEDITERKNFEDNLRLSATVFEGSTEAIIITDARANILRVNSAFTAMTGYADHEVVGKNPRLLKSGNHHEEFYRAMWATLGSTGQWQGEIWNRRKNGDIFPAWLTLCAVRNSEDKITNYVGISRDITLRKEAEERLSYQASHDALTGLPNRARFHDRLTHALARAGRDRHEFAILFLDLDRFKVINDTLGHTVGDFLLQGVTKRLLGGTRESDTLARWGGDEFIILLESIRGAEDAAVAARRILDVLAEPFSVQGHEVFVSGSIGISVYPRDGEDVQALLRCADIAMYRAKDSGKNDYQFYESTMSTGGLERLKLEGDLRYALKRNEFVLHYQPRVNINTGLIVGAEALIRWDLPDRGLLWPLDFIPLAEESGFIIPIGEWVLKTACLQCRKWQDAGVPNPRVSVNLSTHQFKKDNLTSTVDRILKETGLPPGLLELEITESAMMENLEKAVATLQGLAALGVNVAIDDFGTGYSSLGYLKRFPIGALKIDQSFVRHIPSNIDDTAIAMSIISLGKTLSLKVVAEGVETQEQLTVLRNYQCDEAQGYLFSQPVDAERMTEFLVNPSGLNLSDLFEQ